MRRALMIALVVATGCAAPGPTSVVTTTSAELPTAGLHVAPNIVALCKLEARAEERHVLRQVAKCMTTGPLKAKKLGLLGRSDPRVDEELGSFRLAKVRDYLIALGVPARDVVQTSRSSSEENDSRIDLLLIY